MDKKAWIVVTICILLLAANYWFGPEAQEKPATPATPVQTVPAAPAPAATAATDGQTAPAPTAEQPVPAAPAAPQKVTLASLVSRDAEGKEVARFNICNQGGSIASVDMIGKPINSTREELLQDVALNSAAQHGIGTLMFRLSKTARPSYEPTVYELVSQSDKEVKVQGRMGDLLITKTYTLKPLQQGEKTIDGNAYVVALHVDMQNVGKNTLQVANWGVYAGGTSPISGSEGTHFTCYMQMDDGAFDTAKAGDFRPLIFGSDKEFEVTDHHDKLEWIGSMSQYYATILRPVSNASSTVMYAAPVKFVVPDAETAMEGVEAALGMPEVTLPPNAVSSLGYEVFAGPKLNQMLSDMTDDFRKVDRVMDYGILYLLSWPLNWLINAFHSLFGNWGWAIVAMTVVVRILIWPLYRKSYYSMKQMSLLQPRMQELKEKYPDDQQKVSMEMMKLYREYGISPMGGCLPMLLQMPIFFAFFWVLQSAAELRGAEFIFWVTDLSQMDTVCRIPLFGWDIPVNVLPFLMVISMIAQMRMTPSAGDPMQRKIMAFMPVMFFVFCYTYQSALALYWTTTNIISIIQTLIIRRMPQPELKKVAPKKGGKKGFFERMAEAQQRALEEQQRQQQMSRRN